MQKLVDYPDSDQEECPPTPLIIKRVAESPITRPAKNHRKIEKSVHVPPPEQEIQKHREQSARKNNLFSLLPAPKQMESDKSNILGSASDGVNSRVHIIPPAKASTETPTPFKAIIYQASRGKDTVNTPDEQVEYFTFPKHLESKKDNLYGPKRQSEQSSSEIDKKEYNAEPCSNTSYYTDLSAKEYEKYIGAIVDEDIAESKDFVLDEAEMLKIGHRKSREGAIVFQEVCRKDQVGDGYEKQKLRNLTIDTEIGAASAYANLPSMINQGRGTGARNIMSLAFEAKAKQAELDEQRANRKATQKLVRSKYGF